MARQVKCNYKMCNNLGVAVEPVKYKNKYYCKKCAKKLYADKILSKSLLQKKV